MDQVDRVANRVSFAAIVGLVGGAAMATYRGTPVAKSGISVAGTCALIGTACFGLERLSYALLEQTSLLNNSVFSSSADDGAAGESNSNNNNHTNMYVSHAIGGMTGGGIVGGLFQKRPMSGMLVFTPVMVGIAYAELQLQDTRQQRINEKIKLQQSSSQLKNNEANHSNNASQ